MLQNVTEDPTRAQTKWTPKMEDAARLVAEDSKTDEEIAADLSVTRMTLHRWKLLPEFRAKQIEYLNAYIAVVKETGIGSVEARVRAQDARWRGMKQTIRERAVALAGECPGGGTGLHVRETKFVKVLQADKGKARGASSIDDLDDDDFTPTKEMRPVHEYTFDAALAAEMRALEQHTAKELGQWEEKARLSGDPTSPVIILRGVSMDDI